jgi:PIN domain nuclease of toxin-antitoxin system
MKLLLDTHAFLWWDRAPDRLPSRVVRAISRSSNEVYLSVVSLWEVVLKARLGKLRFDTPLQESVEAQQERNGMRLLDVSAAHVWALDTLPATHTDPFDRMLAAQAMHEGLVLVTRDERLKDLKVRTLW